MKNKAFQYEDVSGFVEGSHYGAQQSLGQIHGETEETHSVRRRMAGGWMSLRSKFERSSSAKHLGAKCKTQREMRIRWSSEGIKGKAAAKGAT